MFAPILRTLPVDIISEVMKVVDWKSLLNMRQTCKQFEVISRTHGVWLDQYHQYVEQRMSPARIEEPPDSYSAEELERWVLLRRSADIGWKRQDVKLTQKRWISRKEIGVSHINEACIIPGGRWLLVGGGDGSVTTFDLDASMLKRSPLIPPAEDKQPAHYFAIDIDWYSKTSELTFTMALSGFGTYFTGPPYDLNFHIWQVNLTGHNTEARLIASHLRTIIAHDDSNIDGVALDKKLFACIHSRSDLCYVEVFDWEQSTPSVHCKVIIFTGVRVVSIRFLPGNRLLAFSDTHMMIYPFTVVEGGSSTFPPAVPSHTTEPLWKLPFAGTRTSYGALSQGLVTEVAMHFIIKAKALQEIKIPHDVHKAPSVRELMVLQRPNDLTYAIGFEKAFIQRSDGSIVRLGYSWDIHKLDEDERCVHTCLPVVLGAYPTTPNGARLPKLDEETGRIVQDSQDGVMVIDTAMLYMGREKISTS